MKVNLLTDQRIHSVRKTKEEYLRDRLKRRGIHDIFANITINYSPSDDIKKIWTRLIGLLKKRIEKIPITPEFIAHLSGKITPVIEVVRSDGEYSEALSLLSAVARVPKVSEGVRVQVNAPEFHFKEAFGSTVTELKRRHGKTLGFRWSQNFFTIIDLPRFLAEVILYNSLWSYMRTNLEFVRREYLTQIIRDYKHFRPSTYVASNLVWEQLLHELEEIDPQFTKGNDEGRTRDVSELVDKLLWDVFRDVPDAWDEIQAKPVRLQQAYYYALPPFLRQLSILKEDAEAREESYATHARVWQLKKNIPKKTLRRMHNNAFLSRYGTVELDADVDLQEFSKIETEFRRLCKLIYIPKAPDHSFRIRKLGRYRASGIHFPFHKATCADLDGIGSYVHELGHQIDFSLLRSGEQLSEQFMFQNVYYHYEKAVTSSVNKLPKDHPFRKLWEGKTKYNKRYYLRPTEVFARSFEIYLSRILGIVTSLCNPPRENNPVYPSDPTYLAAVEKYFSAVLPEVIAEDPEDSQKETESQACNFEIDETGQIVFLL